MSKLANLIVIAVLLMCSHSLNIKKASGCKNLACCMSLSSQTGCERDSGCYWRGSSCESFYINCKGDDTCCRSFGQSQTGCEIKSGCFWTNLGCRGQVNVQEQNGCNKNAFPDPSEYRNKMISCCLKNKTELDCRAKINEENCLWQQMRRGNFECRFLNIR